MVGAARAAAMRWRLAAIHGPRRAAPRPNTGASPLTPEGFVKMRSLSSTGAWAAAALQRLISRATASAEAPWRAMTRPWPSKASCCCFQISSTPFCPSGLGCHRHWAPRARTTGLGRGQRCVAPVCGVRALRTASMGVYNVQAGAGAKPGRGAPLRARFRAPELGNRARQ